MNSSKGNCLLFVSLFISFTILAQPKGQPERRTLLVFFDGLRPDYITEQIMPNLYAFSKSGCYSKQHHSVFPTVTRVNAASYSSGSYPGTHGLMGNSVYFPEADKLKALNTGDYADLNKIALATHGELLTSPSLGELLGQAGKKMMVFSSGSTGQALMQNHKISGGAIVNPGLILPESFKATIVSDIGAIPEKSKPNTSQHIWVTNALIKYGITLDGPLVSAIWFSDPDGTAHDDGIGAATSMESIKMVDREFGRILSAIKSQDLDQNFDVIVSADHGFISYAGKQGLTDFIISRGIKKDQMSEDVIIAGGAIYIKDHNADVIQQIVTALQQQDWVGSIFTKASKANKMHGDVAGTLSFESIHWDHKTRAADVLVDENWDDRKNSFGYAGTSFSEGVAGHGGLSPYEVHIALLAAGPSFKKSFSSELPTSNVDIVPTLLAIHKLPVPKSMNGRILDELLIGQKAEKNSIATSETITTKASFAGGTYTLTLYRTNLGKYSYVDYAKVKRTKD